MKCTARYQLALSLLMFLVFVPGEAWGYLDPGSVSLFFQGLVAALFGGLLLVKHYWHQIKGGIKKLFSSSAEHDES